MKTRSKDGLRKKSTVTAGIKQIGGSVSEIGPNSAPNWKKLRPFIQALYDDISIQACFFFKF